MNFKDLKYIIAVADTEHFGRAAQRCFVSQPTLSGQIKKLEEELGVVLFERSNRSVTITPIGADIVSHAKQILERVDVINQLAMAQQDPLAGPIRVGAIPTISPYLIPYVLPSLKKQYPKTQLILSEEITEQLLHRLTSHEIDAALLATPVEEPGLTAAALFDEPFWVAYSRKHEFYTRLKITLRDLEKETLLILGEGHCLAQQTLDLCNIDRDSKNQIADLRATSLETLIQLVGAGYGITLLPALAMGGSWTSGSGVVAQQLSAKNAYRRVSLVYRYNFPRKTALYALAQLIQAKLPNTVKCLKLPRQF